MTVSSKNSLDYAEIRGQLAMIVPMSNDPNILVLAATGNVGSQLVHQLLDAGHGVRAATRNPATAEFPTQVQVVHADLAEPDTLRACVRDFDAVFLLWPLHTGAQFPKALDIIAERARRLVFLGTGGVPDLPYTEQLRLVHGLGIESVVLQPTMFAVNTLWWADQIRAGDIVRGSHGDLSMCPIHEADMAAVARHALTESGHAGATYTMTGPQVLTRAEQVRVIGEALGRPLRWVELTRAEERERLLADPDFPDSYVDVLLDGFDAMRTGPQQFPTSTVTDITGRPPRTLHQWVLDHRAEFR
ncbi:MULTISPECIES: SDR family oxidoreductase [unclassified Nocardia]|uniref:SDR family oxidoreductase n=1 Tax=unclassified Nocardia TaxID=2637762 RepID=UPI001CE3BD56|nr:MULTISPECIES: NAD(P)H-binding protein [unclassified Nocardia]